MKVSYAVISTEQGSTGTAADTTSNSSSSSYSFYSHFTRQQQKEGEEALGHSACSFLRH
jgi:hypothetical protein